MSSTVAYILSGVIGYLLGSISTGILYSRALGRDIRTQGSRNSGATNMSRIHGIGSGLLTLLGDGLKGVIAVLIGRWLGGETGALVGGAMAVIGHMWPVFFGFKGGKGVSTCIGAGVAICPLGTGIAAAVGVLSIVITRFVSVGSMLGLVSFTISASMIVGFWPIGAWGTFLALLVFWRHRSNIQRLIRGTENKFGQKPRDGAE